MMACDRASPVKMLVKSLSQVRQVSAGSNHTVLLTADGSVLTCGSNHVSSHHHHHYDVLSLCGGVISSHLATECQCTGELIISLTLQLSD